MEQSKTTKNNQSENSIVWSKVFVLVSRKQVGTQFRTKDANLKTKNYNCDLWSLALSHIIDLEPLGLCNSEPLKQSRSSCLQMFFKIAGSKKFFNIHRKQLCWSLFKNTTTLLKSNPNTGVFLWTLCNFQEQLFYEAPLVAASGSPTIAQ